jgi:hypothetical protein
MAYRYNEKTGEFEDIPQINPQPVPPRDSLREEPSRKKFDGFFAGLLGLILRIGLYALFYIALSGLVTLCSH